jgi:hypothetical protein
MLMQLSTGNSGAPRVVIVGGGFGGLYTAVRLGSLFWPQGRQPEVGVLGGMSGSTPLAYTSKHISVAA